VVSTNSDPPATDPTTIASTVVIAISLLSAARFRFCSGLLSPTTLTFGKPFTSKKYGYGGAM
ncbi:hypothetical protein LCGC14_2935090, partial [marine sediment metagenome]